jgi:hypothetical protein
VFLAILRYFKEDLAAPWHYLSISPFFCSHEVCVEDLKEKCVEQNLETQLQKFREVCQQSVIAVRAIVYHYAEEAVFY